MRSFLRLLLDALGFALRRFRGLGDDLLRLSTRFKYDLFGALIGFLQLAFRAFRVLYTFANYCLPSFHRSDNGGKSPSPQDQENDGKAEKLREEVESIYPKPAEEIGKDECVHHNVFLHVSEVVRIHPLLCRRRNTLYGAAHTRGKRDVLRPLCRDVNHQCGTGSELR